jgi:hypothetical protein
MFALRERLPLTPVTVTVYVPTGVPLLGGGPVLLLPPPQATKAAASRTRNSDPKASFNRRLFVGMSRRKKAARTAPPRGANQRGPLNKPITVDGAVVLTVSVVEVVGVMELESSEQVASDIAVGTAQVKVTVPVKPLRGLRPIAVLPVAPGDAMAIEFGFGTTLKSGVPLVTVTVTGEEFEFEAK